MTIEKQGSSVVATCDDCGKTIVEADINDLMQICASDGWKLEDLKTKIQHYCRNCGYKHEMAFRMSASTSLSGSVDHAGVVQDVFVSSAQHNSEPKTDKLVEPVKKYGMEF